MLKSLFVQEWMSPATTIAIEKSFRNVIDTMNQADAQCLIVLSENDIVGIITWGDVRAALPGDDTTRAIWDVNNTWERITARQLMSDRVITIRPHAEITRAASIMLHNNISRLPVVDRQGQLVGIITSRDIYRMLVQQRQENTEREEAAAV